jgi:hypothetical protein
MNAQNFNLFASDFTGKKVRIYKPENLTKYASYYPLSKTEIIHTSTKYGIEIGDYIAFDFVTGKSEDNFFKTFVTQFISKYQVKQMIFENGELIYPTKKQCVEKLKNSDRVNKHYFYTTLYGIGIFCFFMHQSSLRSCSCVLDKYLKSINVNYQNEFSEAGWVYRFLIKQSIEKHNELLTNFEM